MGETIGEILNNCFKVVYCQIIDQIMYSIINYGLEYALSYFGVNKMTIFFLLLIL